MSFSLPSISKSSTQFHFLTLDAVKMQSPPQPSHTFTLRVPHTSPPPPQSLPRRPPRLIKDFPHEITTLVLSHVQGPARVKTLLSVALVCRIATIPAQEQLWRSISINDETNRLAVRHYVCSEGTTVKRYRTRELALSGFASPYYALALIGNCGGLRSLRMVASIIGNPLCAKLFFENVSLASKAFDLFPSFSFGRTPTRS